MNERFAEMLREGGKSNSLGRVNEVIEQVLHNKDTLEELYRCMFDDDAWVRMRAADALEKVCRQHPDWLNPYIDRFSDDSLLESTQPSIRWHIAQIYQHVELTDKQRATAMKWLVDQISTSDVDWIVAANSMDTLAYFVEIGSFSRKELIKLLHIQQNHKSNAVVKRATKLLAQISS